MEIVSLDLLKKHVRADDFTADDDILRHYLTAAQDFIVRRVGRPVEELIEMGGGTIPSEIAQATLMIAGHWYNQPEAVASIQMHEVPLGVLSLVKPFIKLVP